MTGTCERSGPDACGGRLLRWGFPLLLGLIALGGLWLRTAALHRSLWLDELAAAWAISDGAAAIPERAWFNNLSALPFYIIWASCSVFGFDEFGIRLPSLAVGVGGILLAAWVVYRLSGSRLAALAAAAMVAGDRDMVRWAVETRPYAIVQFVAMLQAYLFYQVSRRPSLPLRLGWISLSVLLFYLHYTAALLLAAEAVYYALVLIRGRGKAPYGLVQAMVDGAAVILACLPEIGHVLYLKTHQAVLSSWQEKPHYPMECLTVFSFDKNVFFPAVAACAVAFAARRSSQEATPAPASPPAADDGRHLFVFVGCWYLVPVGLAWAAAYVGVMKLFVGRYMIAASLASVVLGCLILVRFRSVAARAAFLAVVLVMHVVFSLAGKGHRLDMQNWRDASRYARSQLTQDEGLVLVQAGLVEEQLLKSDGSKLLRDYLCCPASGLYWKGREKLTRYPLAKDQDVPSEELLRLLGRHRQACVLSLGDVQPSLNRVLSHCAERNIGCRVTAKQCFGDVCVYVLQGAKVDE